MSFSANPIYRPLFSVDANPTETPVEQIDRVISELAKNQASSDVFYADAWNEKFCKETTCLEQSDSAHQKALLKLVASLQQYPVQKIAARFKDLYAQAYHYNSSTYRMDLGQDDNSLAAKRQLDLWTGLVDYLSVRDKDFLDSITSGDVALIETLNSPNLSPKHRGFFYQFEHGLKKFYHFDQMYYDLLISAKNPEDKSYFELETAMREKMGDKAFSAERSRGPSPQQIDAVLAALDPQRIIWKALDGQSPHDLAYSIFDFLDRGKVKETKNNPLFENPHFLAIALLKLESRGGHLNAMMGPLLEESTHQEKVSREEVELMTGISKDWRRGVISWNNDLALITASHVDDYQWRFRYLSAIVKDYVNFRESLSHSIVRPYAEKVIEHAFDHCVTFEDFKLIQNKASELMPIPSAPVAFDTLMDPDHSDNIVLRPQDLPPEVLSLAEKISVGPSTVKDYIFENVDYVVIMPDKEFEKVMKEAAATTFTPYKVVFVTKQNTHVEGWYPSTFLGALGHEASHVFFDQRKSFTNSVESERYAYLYQLNVLRALPFPGFAPRQIESEWFETQITKGRVKAANEVLGLPSDNEELKFFDVPVKAKQDEAFIEAMSKHDLAPSIVNLALELGLMYSATSLIPQQLLRTSNSKLSQRDLNQAIQDKCGSSGAVNKEALQKELLKPGRFSWIESTLGFYLGIKGAIHLMGEEQHEGWTSIGLGTLLSASPRRAGLLSRILPLTNGSFYQRRLTEVTSKIECNSSSVPIDTQNLARESLRIYGGLSTPITSSGLSHIGVSATAHGLGITITPVMTEPLSIPTIRIPSFIPEPVFVVP